MKIRNNKATYFMAVLVNMLISLIYCQDPARDSILIFHEVKIGIGRMGSFDPYYAFIKDKEKRNHPIYKRFFSLYHETLVEKARNKVYPNFVHSEENVSMDMSALVDPIRSKIIFILPDEYEEPWEFHNGAMINADDLITSIKYAICRGSLSDKIFKNELIQKEGEYKFSISFNLEFNRDIIFSYLRNVYVIPYEIFGGFVNEQNCMDPYNIEEQPYDIAAGPFKCNNCESEEKVVLIHNEKYPKRPFINGVTIKEFSIKADHYNLLVAEGESNIAIDIPPGTIVAALDNILANRLEGWKVQALFFDYSNPIFQIKEFRKLISKLFDVELFIINKLDNQANLVTGPYSTLHTGNNPDVKRYLTNEERLSYRKNSSTYLESIKEKIEQIEEFRYEGSQRKNLFYGDQKVQIIFTYNRKRMTKNEEDATDAIIQRLREIGIDVPTPMPQDDNSIKITRKDPNRWDIIYDEIEIQLNETAGEYFYTKSFFNYHRYNNKQLDKLFKVEQTTLDPGRLNSIKKEIHKILREDYAAIFLWSMYNYYAFDTNYMSRKNNHLINSTNFFTTPERWKMIRHEDK